MSAIAFVYLVLPQGDLGQRENLLIIFTIPYIMLIYSMLTNCRPASNVTAIVIGLLAGIGFALKPYFYLTFILLEGYACLTRKNWFTWLRPEVITIITFAAAYFAFIFILHRDYITFILPLIIHSYYQKYDRGLNILFTGQKSVFMYFTALFYMLSVPYTRHKHLCTLLLLTAVGFWMAFIIQRVNWYYHEIPFFSADILLAVLLFSGLTSQPFLAMRDYLLLGTFTLLLLIYYGLKISILQQSIIYFPFTFFALFAFIFFIVSFNAFSATSTRIYKTSGSITILIALNILFSCYINFTAWRAHQFSLTIVMLLLPFLMFLPKHEAKEKCHEGFLAIVGILLFTIPFYQLTYINNYSTYYSKLYMQFIQAMQPYRQKNVYYISNTSDLEFPVVDYTNQQYASRMWSMAWLPTIENPEKASLYPAFYQTHRKEMDLYINIIIRDFNRHHPDYVFVDTRKKGHYFFNVTPNYLALFSLHDGFNKIWRDYHYVRTIDNPPLYQFQIYQRN
jgi:hypothetical protein